MIFRCLLPLILLSVYLCVSSAALVDLPPPKEKFNMLMLLPFASQSHRNCFLPLAESLAERGHKIVILSPLPPVNKHPNIKEINHGIDLMESFVSMFEVREKDPSGGFQFFQYILPRLAREMYDVPEVKELYETRNQFDMLFIDSLFNEPAFPFLENSSFIAISTAGVMPDASASFGNVLNPSFVPSLSNDFPRPYSFFHRFRNLFNHISFPIYWRKLILYPLVEQELKAKFPHMPSLTEMEKGRVLELSNTHFSLDSPVPLLPSQVEVGGMHCRPGKPLPQDLEEFINASETGVVYFSLGSICESKTIPEKFKQTLIKAFQKLKYRVIWKFEDEFPNLPNNIIVKKWLPQQDILAHPNVKLFITHGGLLSMQESIYHGTPLLALPVFGDQVRNGQRIVNKGFGTYLEWEDLTEELIISTIEELIQNPRYREKVEAVSNSFRDQLTLPLERAVWWTEYVTRNKANLMIKSHGADLSWIEYLMIDVILAIHAVVLISFYLLKKIIKFIIYSISSSSKNKTSLKRKKE